MNSIERLTKGDQAAVGVSFLLPGQAKMRSEARGRYGVYQNDATAGRQHHAYHVVLHDDGTADVGGLEPDGDVWFDLGGTNARDWMAGR